MEYVLLINASEESFKDRQNENQQSYWGGWSAYVKAINEAGIVVSGSGLQGPDTATTVLYKKDEKIIHDGPFVDAKEQLGGFFVVQVENLNQALEWARRCPITKGGSVQVRPVLPPMPG